ncbi:MAG: TrmH family RNA methyltransferase [Candidatus Saccharimonadales bacterium]
MRQIALIAHNIRSCHNVGSLLRTADGLGISAVYLTGYTPYPVSPADERLPYQANKIHARIHKTALGAEQSINWHHSQQIEPIIHKLKQSDFTIIALEQDKNAISLANFSPDQRIALIIGSEVSGIEVDILANCDAIVEIPMFGKKESFNVASGAAMALYQLRFAD